MKQALEFTTDELNLIIAALAELPAKHSMALISNIQQQVAQPQPASQKAKLIDD